MKNKNEEYEALKKKALEQFKRGQPLLGKDGAFAPLLKEFLESALEAEVEEHLDEGERQRVNKDYQNVLTLRGDAEKGKNIFLINCSSCHNRDHTHSNCQSCCLGFK